jgi:hypothetical protein
MNEVPVLRDMHMLGIIPVSVVDEEKAVRFPFWQRSSGADERRRLQSFIAVKIETPAAWSSTAKAAVPIL